MPTILSAEEYIKVNNFRIANIGLNVVERRKGQREIDLCSNYIDDQGDIQTPVCISYFEARNIILLVDNTREKIHYGVYAPDTNTILVIQTSNVSAPRITADSFENFKLFINQSKHFEVTSTNLFSFSDPNFGVWTSLFLPRILISVCAGFTTAAFTSNEIQSESLDYLAKGKCAEFKLDPLQYSFHVKHGFFFLPKSTGIISSVYELFLRDFAKPSPDAPGDASKKRVAIGGRYASRIIVNYNELKASLIAEGFFFVDANELRFAELLALMQQADELVTIYSPEMPCLTLASTTTKIGVIFNSSHFFSDHQDTQDEIKNIVAGRKFKPLFGRQLKFNDNPLFAQYTAPLGSTRFIGFQK